MALKFKTFGLSNSEVITRGTHHLNIKTVIAVFLDFVAYHPYYDSRQMVSRVQEQHDNNLIICLVTSDSSQTHHPSKFTAIKRSLAAINRINVILSFITSGF